MMTVWSQRIHTSGVERQFLRSSDHWDLIVFSLPEIKCCNLEWMSVFYTNKLKDTKDIQDVVLLLSKDDNKLSEDQVNSWVDNYKTSLNRKKQTGKQTDPKDKDQQ